jgi:alginate O-acetyltransferase complex protein AlgI
MLFNSYIFIFIFLPIVYLGFLFLVKKTSSELAIIWLVISSLFFYGWWNYSYVLLILTSIIFNYLCGKLIYKNSSINILYIGLGGNLALIGYFKYSNFFIANINTYSDINIEFNEILLPLAISFFTFQQIAFLVDTYRNETKEYNFWHYCLFVTFFPQLLAGPIVHHKEVIYQFADSLKDRLNLKNLIIGLSIFSIGLFKKVILADTVESYSTPLFIAAERGEILTFIESWLGVISYSLQIYFDFSGYCDMAIGLARIFGIMLPLNFNSPYKSKSIIEFWRRWHITLSRFLKEYLYFTIGGNKKGSFRKYINLFVTMVLGGLWHGAGWTFIFWGGLHGFYLIINHLWRNIFNSFAISDYNFGVISSSLSRILTLFFVIIAWVFFRAETLDGSMAIFRGMFGENGIVLPDFYFYRLGNIAIYMQDLGIKFGSIAYYYGTQQVFVMISMVFIVFFMPNTQEFFAKYNSALNYNEAIKYKILSWDFTPFWAIIMSLVGVISILSITQISEFIYFQF